MQSFTGLFRDTSLSESFERVFSCQKVVLVACRRWLRDLELRVVESLPPSSHAHQTQEAPCPGLAGGRGRLEISWMPRGQQRGPRHSWSERPFLWTPSVEQGCSVGQKRGQELRSLMDLGLNSELVTSCVVLSLF